MLTRSFALVLLLVVKLSIVQASTNEIQLKATGVSTLEAGPIKAAVKLERLAKDCPSAGSWEWGSELSCPDRRVALLKVLFNGQQVFIPYSAFADLGNPRSISIERSAKESTYSIKIIGGDAATSYNAILRFKGTLLLERIVRHGEFPDDAWEKTIYKWNLIEN